VIVGVFNFFSHTEICAYS